MTALTMLLCLVAGALIQALAPVWPVLGQAGFPVLLCLVLYYALEHDETSMLFCAVAAGILQDSLGMIPLGYSSFCFCVAGIVASRFKEMVFVREGFTHLVFGALCAGGVSLALSLLLALAGLVSMRPGWMALKTLGAALLGAAMAPAVFLLLRALDRMLGNVPEQEA